MSNNNYNPETLKTAVKKGKAAALQVPLDYLYTKRTVPSKRVKSCSDFFKSKTRFYDDDRWHTADFKRYAEFCNTVKFNYRGADCMGELVAVNGGTFRPRWSAEYKRLAMARCYRFGEGCREEYGNPDGTISGHFVTLTVWHRTSGSYKSMRETVEKLNAAWKSIYKWVNRRGWRFLRVMEPGEVGHYPHYHMIIVGATNEEIDEFKQHWIDNCKMKGIWASIKAQDSREVADIRNPGAYIVKYISKSFGDDEESDDDEWYWRWQELCYRENDCGRGFHVYAMDRKTSKYITKYYGHRKPAGVGQIEVITPEKERDNHLDYEKEQLELKLREVDELESRALANPNEKAEDSRVRSTLLTLRGDENPTCLGSQSARILTGGLGACPPEIRRGDTVE